jgi:hypothetical protein
MLLVVAPIAGVLFIFALTLSLSHKGRGNPKAQLS